MAHLAQLNLARLKEPKPSPVTREFFDAIAPINALAEVQPGFLWRLVGDVRDHTDIEAFLDPHLVVNISLWKDLDSLSHFVYRTGHVQYIKRRKEWFDSFDGAYNVLWWVKEGDIPTLAEAKAKLDQLKQGGPTPEAFNLKVLYSAEGHRVPDHLSRRGIESP
jgi:hypothetical protein